MRRGAAATGGPGAWVCGVGACVRGCAVAPASRRGSIDHAMLASACSRAACGLIARSDGSARLHAPGVFGVNAAGASPRPVAAYASTRFGCESGGGPETRGRAHDGPRGGPLRGL